MDSLSFRTILEMDLLLNKCKLHLKAKISCSQNSSIDEPWQKHNSEGVFPCLLGGLGFGRVI